MAESHCVHGMTYGCHRVVDDHSWVVLMKMVAQSLVGCLGVGKGEWIYTFKHSCSQWRGHPHPFFSSCCRQLGNTEVSQRSHRKVNLLFFILLFFLRVHLGYVMASNIKLNNVIRGVLCKDSDTVSYYKLVKTIQVGSTDPATVAVFAYLHSKHALSCRLYN